MSKIIKQEGSKKDNLGGITIKTEPGTSTSPVMQRLPSLRGPRDLTLSAYSQKFSNPNQSKNKKVYIPNLNVTRNKPQASENAESVPKVVHTKPNLPDKNQRRGRGARNLIQLNHGVFSEGIPAGLKNVGRGHSSGGGGGVGGDAENLRIPKLKLEDNYKIDKEQEKNTINKLLQDNFIDDPDTKVDLTNCPITLPLLNVKKEEEKEESDFKSVYKKEKLTIDDVLNCEKTPDPGFIFFQLPSSMPGLQAEQKHNLQSAPSTETPEPDMEQCDLSTLPVGQIGKLQILKSGRACLVFGQTKMWVDIATPPTYKQDLVSVEVNRETHTGHTINMGAVNVSMIATPDWETMMASA